MQKNAYTNEWNLRAKIRNSTRAYCVIAGMHATFFQRISNLSQTRKYHPNWMELFKFNENQTEIRGPVVCTLYSTLCRRQSSFKKDRMIWLLALHCAVVKMWRVHCSMKILFFDVWFSCRTVLLDRSWRQKQCDAAGFFVYLYSPNICLLSAIM